MFEFGNQKMRCYEVKWDIPAKEYFQSLGIEHVSLDLNGKDGALKRNILDPVDDLGEFDVVTNFGSSEHIDPESQPKVFEHLHQLCKTGGYMIHHVPEVGSWKGHGKYYYTVDFFRHLPGEIVWLEARRLQDHKNNVNIECILRKQ